MASSLYIKFTVTGTIEKLFTIKLDKSEPYHSGERMSITGTGGEKSHNVVILVLGSNSTKIQQLETRTTNDGSFKTLWTLPTDIQLGKYTVRANAGQPTAETTFEIQ